MISVDRTLYPFESRWTESTDGRIHYADEGSGNPILFVHGTPTWSLLYRHAIAKLRNGHRCIAPDFLGHGQSDRPSTADYRPEAHARRLREFIEDLDLSGITLVVHDFGGPVGLRCLLDLPDRFARVVVSNTWMWPIDDRRLQAVDRFVNSKLGEFLYLRANISVNVLLPSLFARRQLLTKELHGAFKAPFPDAPSRLPLLTLAKSLKGSSSFYDGLWSQRDILLSKPLHVLWGKRDPSFPLAMERWKEIATGRVLELPAAGHFVWEEAAEESVAFLEQVIKDDRA